MRQDGGGVDMEKEMTLIFGKYSLLSNPNSHGFKKIWFIENSGPGGTMR